MPIKKDSKEIGSKENIVSSVDRKSSMKILPHIKTWLLIIILNRKIDPNLINTFWSWCSKLWEEEGFTVLGDGGRATATLGIRYSCTSDTLKYISISVGISVGIYPYHYFPFYITAAVQLIIVLNLPMKTILTLNLRMDCSVIISWI